VRLDAVENWPSVSSKRLKVEIARIVTRWQHLTTKLPMSKRRMRSCRFVFALHHAIYGRGRPTRAMRYETAAGLSNMTRSTSLAAIRAIPRRGLSRDEAATDIGISASKFAGERAVVRFVHVAPPPWSLDGAVNMIRSHIRPGYRRSNRGYWRDRRTQIVLDSSRAVAKSFAAFRPLGA
jgi:hypothetical protein